MANTNRRGNPSLAVLTVCNLLILAGIAGRERPVAGQETPALIRARAIELVDAQGQVRAQLNIEQGGEAVMRLRGPDGAIRVKIGASKDGSGLLLLDGATEPALHALAKRTDTSLTLRQGTRQQVIRP